VDLISLIEVGEMHFYGWKWHGFDHIVKGNTGETEAGGIYDCAIDVVNMRLKGIDQHAFVIGLLGEHFDAKVGRELAYALIDELQSLCSVNIRLTPAEEIRVWSMQDEKPKPARPVGRWIFSVHGCHPIDKEPDPTMFYGVDTVSPAGFRHIC
jgi:hypothetical protein